MVTDSNVPRRLRSAARTPGATGLVPAAVFSIHANEVRMRAYARLVGSALILGLALPAVAAAQDAVLPQPKTEGSVTYLSGGVGSDEAMALKQAQKRYPLSMTFSEGNRGEYLSDVHVTITNKDGNTILQAVSDGPIMLVDLPAGDYRIDAQANGRTLHRDARVGARGDTHLSFNWPQA
jgi:hypothetical protein